MFGDTRMNFSGTRFSQNNLSARKNVYASTSSSFGRNLSKSSFSIRRPVSTSFRNTQGKLDTLKDELGDIESGTKNMREKTKVF